MLFLLALLTVVTLVVSFLGFGGVLDLPSHLTHLLLPVAMGLFVLTLMCQFAARRKAASAAPPSALPPSPPAP